MFDKFDARSAVLLGGILMLAVSAMSFFLGDALVPGSSARGYLFGAMGGVMTGAAAASLVRNALRRHASRRDNP